jgi:hypothetical protein
MIVPFTEKRACPRFNIPGAMVSYRKVRWLFGPSGWNEQSCLVVDLSRGGIRFLTRQIPSLGVKLEIALTWPEEKNGLRLLGRVRWRSEYSGDQFRYSVGVQFQPYGEGKKHNSTEVLDRIVGLENKLLAR